MWLRKSRSPFGVNGAADRCPGDAAEKLALPTANLTNADLANRRSPFVLSNPLT
jgi:hypothetical protein